MLGMSPSTESKDRGDPDEHLSSERIVTAPNRRSTPVNGGRLIWELERSPDTWRMGRVVEAALSNWLGDDDVAHLAQVLARSGVSLPVRGDAADIASTGGPSSLSTLLCPLQLRVRGLTVPKLGVPGRPAGGIDVLQTIPGYRAVLEPDEVRGLLDRSGYVHLLADERWATLDAKLFTYRQQSGAQGVPTLVIASILAKKLAAGATGAGLEVRVAPHGNFGANMEQARLNARRFVAVASLLGLRPIVVLTDGSRPYQPYIGRGEALIALDDVLQGSAYGWLAEHQALCLRMSDAMVRAMGAAAILSIEPAELRRAHEAMLVGHGASLAAFQARVVAVRSAARVPVSAVRAGYVQYDLSRMRDLLVTRQREDPVLTDQSLPDPAGVVLAVRPGAWVKDGAELMSVRAPRGDEGLVRALGECVSVHDHIEGETIAPDTLELI
jgi:thymidine phosphorylase